MVRILTGNLFESGAQTLVNTVNGVGVMGAGIALEFKRRFPDMYEDYVARCKSRQVQLGQPYLYRRPTPPWILNFPTKGHWREVSRLADVEAGMVHLERNYAEWGITSLAVPPLGCGQGGLEWRVVGRVLVRHLEHLTIPVMLYAPYGTPQLELDPTYLTQNDTDAVTTVGLGLPSKIRPALVAMVEVLARIERERYHWPVGRVAFQKLAYFATQAGLPTGLNYLRGSYGPFAPELKRVESQLVNNGLLVEESRGRMLVVRPGPTYADAIESYEADIAGWHEIVGRVADLVLRLQSPNGRDLEVAATAFFVAQEMGALNGGEPTESDVLREVQRWKVRRRPPFTDEEVARAIRIIHLLGWLRLRPSADLPLPEDELVEA